MTGKYQKYGVLVTLAAMGVGAIAPLSGLCFAFVWDAYDSKDRKYMTKTIQLFALLYCSLGVYALTLYILQGYWKGLFGETLINRVRENLLVSKSLSKVSLCRDEKLKFCNLTDVIQVFWCI
jgi:hypothetical protein